MVRTRLSCVVMLATLALLALAGAADGAALFSDSLKGGSLPATFTLGSNAGGRAPTFDASGVTFAGDGDNARNYLRTVDTDYDTISFTAYIMVTTQLGNSFDADSQLFFGLGTGEPGQYGVPDRENHAGVYLNLNHPDGLSILQLSTASSDTKLAGTEYSGVDTSQVTTTAVKFMHDAAADTVAFEVDYEYAGDGTYAAFTADQTVGPAVIPAATLASWAAGDARSIVFGGDSDGSSDLLVSDFTVVPEPATLALLAVAGLTLLPRRRTA